MLRLKPTMADCHLHHHNYSNDDKPVSPLVAAILLEDVDAMKAIVKSDVLSLTEDVDGWDLGPHPLVCCRKGGEGQGNHSSHFLPG